MRTVYSLEVANKTYKEKYDTVILKITGNGFLYNMVRIIAGTLVQVGKGQIEPEYIKEMLEKCDRTAAGQTAPPQGLTLVNIQYDESDYRVNRDI